MRKITCILLVLLLMLPGCGNVQEPENPYRLKTQIHETYRDGETFSWRFEYIYDENGWLMEMQEYENDAPDEKIIYEHDPYGNTIRTTIIHSDGTQDVGEDQLTLDDQHRIIYSESYWNGTLNGTTEYGYNGDGQVTKLYINRIDALEGEDWKSFVDRTYDRKGNLVRQDTRWEPQDSGNSYTLCTYEQDRLLRTETYVSELLDSYTDYTYDETGLIQTSIERSADGTLQCKRVTTSDEYGNQLEVITYSYASDRVRYGTNNEEPDSRTINAYELK